MGVAKAPGERVRTRLIRNERGQMSVELMVVLSVVIAIAVVAVNALTFFSECAAFDRACRNAVRLYATSPGYGQDVGQSIALVQDAAQKVCSLANEEVEVSAHQEALGHTIFEMTLVFHPTLFGLGLKDEVFGVALPALRHTTSLAVDSYKPGVLL